MHPELYMVVYRQQEKELEARLERRRIDAERAGDRLGRTPPRRRAPWRKPFRLARRTGSTVVDA